MEYVTLGKSDLKVSKLCLGCMSFGKTKEGTSGWTLNQEQTDEMIKRALDLGINFFDTLIFIVMVQVRFSLEILLKNMLRTEKILL